jgi:3-phenylpropionate/trans-cinnamate dioxygenase ferredoxin reductase component
MEYFGHVGRAGFDDLRIEGDDPESFACFWTRGNRLVAAMHVNQWDRSDELKARVQRAAEG